MQADERDSPPVASPCIRNCCLNDQNVCLGCFRTLDEITGWQNTSNPNRILVLERSAQRREAHEQKFPSFSRGALIGPNEF